jgi:hypothetical protein
VCCESLIWIIRHHWWLACGIITRVVHAMQGTGKRGPSAFNSWHVLVVASVGHAASLLAVYRQVTQPLRVFAPCVTRALIRFSYADRAHDQARENNPPKT